MNKLKCDENANLLPLTNNIEAKLYVVGFVFVFEVHVWIHFVRDK
jgi:hypothetical protein